MFRIKNGIIQSMCIYNVEDDHIHISYLCSISSKRGLGKELINEIKKKLDDKINYIELQSVNSAKGFYEKMGFTNEDEEGCDMCIMIYMN